jgi:hypothetical protein
MSEIRSRVERRGNVFVAVIEGPLPHQIVEFPYPTEAAATKKLADKLERWRRFSNERRDQVVQHFGAER